MGKWSRPDGDITIASKEVKVVENFIERYVAYASSLTDSPKEYHEAVALFCIACAVKGNVYSQLSIGKHRPHVMFVLLGNSTRFRKSTSINIGQDVLNRAGIEFLPSSFTIEGILDKLEDNPQNGIIRDEFAGFLREFKKSYMEGAKEFICNLYDSKTFDRVLRKKSWRIVDPSVSFLSSTVPEHFADAIEPEDFLSGFVPRFMMFNPDAPTEKARRITEYTQLHEDERDILVDTLRFIRSKFSEPIFCSVRDESLELLNQWIDDNARDEESSEDRADMSAWYGRLNDYVIKIALLKEACRMINDVRLNSSDIKYLVMNPESMKYSINYMKDYKTKYIKKVKSFINFHFNERVYNCIERLVDENGEVPYSMLLRGVKRSTTEEVKKALETLIDQERVERVSLAKRNLTIKLKDYRKVNNV